MTSENDPNLISDAVGWVAAAFAGLLAWVGKSQMARIDAHDQQLAGMVTKSDLKQMEDRTITAIRDIAKSITERVDDAREDATAAHKRIDDMMQRER